MAQYFQQPYPARAAIGVAALPKAVGVEMDAVLVIDSWSLYVGMRSTECPR
jgi:enamine deaminase RidA (YjgF/YER057c/UK114 family)